MDFKHFESIVSCYLPDNLPFDMDKRMNDAGLLSGLRPVGDEHVQYARIFAWGVEGCGEEETCFVWEAHVGNWIYQENVVGGV